VIAGVLLGVMPAFADEETKVPTLIKTGTFFVAPNGNDTWSGRIPQANANRTDGPFATLHAACGASRKLGTKQPRKVIVQAGQYFFDKPLVLNDKNAGLTKWVRIKSLAGEPCRVRPGISGQVHIKSDRPLKLKQASRGIYEINMKKGDEVLLYTAN